MRLTRLGNSLGPLKDGTGKVITNPGLWALVFRNDGVGNPNTLYFTAGPNKQDGGLFGAISFHNYVLSRVPNLARIGGAALVVPGLVDQALQVNTGAPA
jgi:hypothetical protein